MDNEKNTSFKNFFLGNIPWIAATAVSLVNLYFLSILAPIKSDITMIARAQEELSADVKNINENGSTKSKLNEARINNVEDDIKEIKVYLKEINQKIDQQRK